MKTCKRTRMRRTLPLLLSLLLVLTAIPAMAEASEPVRLDVFYASNRPMNEATDLTRQFMIDNLGVDFNLIQGDSDNFDQQLALYISSGDMPDVIWCSYATWKEYASEGAWANLTDFLTEEAYPNLMKYVGDSWPYVTVDGEIQAVPSLLNTPSGQIMAIRGDWLENLELEIPRTLDEYTEVMRAFRTQDPDGDGEMNTWGLSGAGLSYLSPFMGAFGASAEDDFFLNDDGTIETNAISENYRSSLRYLRDIYAEGLIDPEMFTSDDAQAYNKWGRGEMGVCPGWWSFPGNAYLRYDFGVLQPDAKVEIILPPVGSEGKSGMLNAAPFSSVIGVSYKCDEEKINAALHLLDWQATDIGFLTVEFGVEGEFFTYDEELHCPNWTWEFNGGKSKSGKYETTDMEVYKMLFNEKLQNMHYAFDDAIYNQMYALGSEMRYIEPTREDVFALFNTEEYLSVRSDINAHFEQNMLAFIMGEKDIEADWETYVQDYLSLAETARQSRLAAYNETFGTEYTFAE